MHFQCTGTVDRALYSRTCIDTIREDLRDGGIAARTKDAGRGVGGHAVEDIAAGDVGGEWRMAGDGLGVCAEDDGDVVVAAWRGHVSAGMSISRRLYILFSLLLLLCAQERLVIKIATFTHQYSSQCRPATPPQPRIAISAPQPPCESCSDSPCRPCGRQSEPAVRSRAPRRPWRGTEGARCRLRGRGCGRPASIF